MTDKEIRVISKFLNGESSINDDVIDSGYIPVEYNYYKELIEKAAKYDKIQAYISEMENKNADI